MHAHARRQHALLLAAAPLARPAPHFCAPRSRTALEDVYLHAAPANGSVLSPGALQWRGTHEGTAHTIHHDHSPARDVPAHNTVRRPSTRACRPVPVGLDDASSASATARVWCGQRASRVRAPRARRLPPPPTDRQPRGTAKRRIPVLNMHMLTNNSCPTSASQRQGNCAQRARESAALSGRLSPQVRTVR